jgi:hypothetical protein
MLTKVAGQRLRQAIEKYPQGALCTEFGNSKGETSRVVAKVSSICWQTSPTPSSVAKTARSDPGGKGLD